MPKSNTMATPAEIRSTIFTLPPAERAELAHDIIASLDADRAHPQAEALWVAEIERRAREVAEGKVELIDADVVHAEISALLRARGGR